MKQQTTKILTILLILTLVITGCSNNTTTNNNQSSTSNQKEIKIGLIAATTGWASHLGVPQVEGATIAVEELRKQGYNIELIIEDSHCDPQAATKAFNKLATIDNVDYVIGPTCSFENEAIGPIAEQYQIPVFALGATASLASIGEYTIPYNENPIEEGKRLTNYANRHGYNNAGAVYYQVSYPLEVAQGVKEATNNYALDAQLNDFSISDFKTIFIQAKQNKVNAIYTETGQEEIVLRQLHEIDYQGLIMFSTNAFREDVPTYTKPNQNVIVLYQNLENSNYEDFEKLYIKKYNKKTNRKFNTALGFDAVNEIIQNKDIPKNKIKTTIISQTHIGASGELSYIDGQPHRDFDIYTIKNNEFIKIE